LGLTATPKRQDNVDTYEYFGVPDEGFLAFLSFDYERT
jgi:type I site-specific restriction endonuclease